MGDLLETNSSYWNQELSKFNFNTNEKNKTDGISVKQPSSSEVQNLEHKFGTLVDLSDTDSTSTNSQSESPIADETEHIHCSLNDLILGLESTVIVKAIDKMKAEEKAFLKKKQASKTKFNLEAKEFSFNFAPQRKFDKNVFMATAKEFIPHSKKVET